MHSVTILFAGPTICYGRIRTDEIRLMYFNSHTEYPISDYKRNCSIREVKIPQVTQFIKYRREQIWGNATICT